MYAFLRKSLLYHSVYFDIFEKSQFNGFVSKKIIVHLQTDNKNQTI